MSPTGIIARIVVIVSALALGCDEKAASQPAAPAASPSAAATVPSAAASEASAEAPVRVITEEVRYAVGKTTMKGYLAYPVGAKGLPGVLVVHEWWGLNEYAKTRAEMLAKEGYAALAVDMYGDGKTADNPDDAKKLSGEIYGNLDVAEERFKAAKKLLEDHASTDPGKVAAIGYCFGGGVVLHMVRSGVELDAIASFHGILATKTPAAKDSIKGKVMIAHGAADPMVPPAQVEGFKKEMAAAGVDLRFHAYEGAKHAFSNPAATKTGEKYNLPVAYDEKADKASWSELLALLREVFPTEKR